jgi:hypothetical protein
LGGNDDRHAPSLVWITSSFSPVLVFFSGIQIVIGPGGELEHCYTHILDFLLLSDIKLSWFTFLILFANSVCIECVFVQVREFSSDIYRCQ